MLEAKIQHASVLRRLFESIKDMVSDVNLDCDETGLRLQVKTRAVDASNRNDSSTLAKSLAFLSLLFSLCLEEGGISLHLASLHSPY